MIFENTFFCPTRLLLPLLESMFFLFPAKTLISWVCGWLAGWLAGWLGGWLAGWKESELGLI
jgi:hypothetical protein